MRRTRCACSPRARRELEREFAFGVVRQLFEADVADPARGPAALAGAAAPAAAVFGAPDAGEARASRRSPPCTASSGSPPTSPPSGRCCSRSTTCTGATGRRCASSPTSRAGSRALPILLAATRAQRRAGHRPDAARRDRPRPGGARAPARAAERGGRRRAGARRGSARDADAAFCAACHDGDRRQPAAPAPAPARARGRGRRARRRQRRRRARRRPARGVEHRAACGSAACPRDAVAVARAVSVLGESAELPAVAALAGLDEPAVAAATGELARAEILRPDPPLGFVHPLVRDAVYHELPPGERALLHERAARAAARRGRAGRAGRRAAARGAAARRGVGRRRCWRRRRATAMRRGRGRQRRRLPAPRARGAAAAGPARRRCCSALGTAEALTSGPAGRRAPAGGLRRCSTTRSRARSVADGLARVLIFTGRAPTRRPTLARAAPPPRSRRAGRRSRRCSRRSSWPRTTSAGSRPTHARARRRAPRAPARAAAAARRSPRSTGRTAAASADALLRARAARRSSAAT